MISSERLFEGIIDQIMNEGTFLIPNFVRFESSYKSADVDPIAGVIYPPSQSLSVLPTKDKNPKSLQTLAASLNIPFLLLEKYVSELSDDWKSKLDNNEIVDLKGLGRLYIEYNRALKFSQSIQNQRFNLSNLPELQFKPLTRDFASSKASRNLQTAEQKFNNRPLRRQKSFNWSEYLPVLVGVGCFVLILGFYFLLPEQPNFADQNLSNKVKVERVNQKPSHELNLSLAKDTFSDKNLADEILEAEVASVLEAPKMKISPTETQENPKKEITRLLPKEAIIITGAYKNYEGAKRKINTIIGLGFNPYQDQKGDLHRVGVIFSYQEDREVDSMLSKIKAEFSSSAWVLN